MMYASMHLASKGIQVLLLPMKLYDIHWQTLIFIMNTKFKSYIAIYLLSNE